MATPKHNQNGHRRRELVKRIKGTATQCALCGGRLYPDASWPDDLCTVVDEDLPRARGGDPLDRANTNALHNVCNRFKSTMTLAEARQLLALGATPTKPLTRQQRRDLLNPHVGQWDDVAAHY